MAEEQTSSWQKEFRRVVPTKNRRISGFVIEGLRSKEEPHTLQHAEHAIWRSICLLFERAEEEKKLKKLKLRKR